MGGGRASRARPLRHARYRAASALAAGRGARTAPRSGRASSRSGRAARGSRARTAAGAGSPRARLTGRRMEFERIAIVGAGAWGTALANAIARAGRSVTLVGRDQASADTIAITRASTRLAGTRIEDRVAIAAAGAAELGSQDAILLAVPSQQLRAAARATAPALAAN